MSEKVKKTTPGKAKVSKTKAVAVKPGIKSTPVKRSGCFKERPIRSRKKSAKKSVRPKPGYSLCTSDSEDQLSHSNCGIDRCSELLSHLIQRKKAGQYTRSIKPGIQDGHFDKTRGPEASSAQHTKDVVFVPTAGTESPDTQVAIMVDGRLARSRAPLVEVRTPFNQRLVSSTPDPDKNVDDDGYTQLIAEKDSYTNRVKLVVKTVSDSTNSHKKNAQSLPKMKVDDNQNYIKEDGHFEKAFRPIRFHADSDFIEGVRRFEETFPVCHNRKSSIGDLQCYQPRESTGFSPNILQPAPDTGGNSSVRNDVHETDERTNKNDSSGINSEEKSQPHNRDYLDDKDDDDDLLDEYSAPVFNSYQVKMFGPGYRRRNSKDEDSDEESTDPEPRGTTKEAQQPERAETPDTQYNLSQKLNTTEPAAKQSWNSKRSVPEKQGSGRADTEKATADPDFHHTTTPMPSPARQLSAEPRPILGRHIVKAGQKMSVVSGYQADDMFINYEPTHDRNNHNNEQDDGREGYCEMSSMLGHVNLNTEHEAYPISLINPATLDTNIGISKPVASRSPMLETPANSPVSIPPRKYAQGLRESTLKRVSFESAHQFAGNMRDRGASSNLETRFHDDPKCVSEMEDTEVENYEYETAPFYSEPAEHGWTMTPMNSPAGRVQQDLKTRGHAGLSANQQPEPGTPFSYNPHGPGKQIPFTRSAVPTRVDATTGPRRLRYLVKELSDACKIKGGTELQGIADDLADCLESIPQLKHTFNLQTEIDLLLQPLRSENSQFRRRLRIVNQQLKERERQEKENNNHGINFEMLHLQTDNVTLHRQLKEEKELSQRLSQEVERMKYERQRFIVVLSDKKTEGSRAREECIKENQSLRFELELAHKQLEGSKLRQAAMDSEKRIIEVSLSQRDMEINRLQDLVQTLKDGVGDVLRTLDNGCHNNGTTENSFSLQKMLMVLNTHGLGSSPAKSVMSDPGQQTAAKKVGSAKKVLQFDNNPAASRKGKVSPLSKEALHRHNKQLRKDVLSTTDVDSLEKDFQKYMSPYNSSPKSDQGSVTNLLPRNFSSKNLDNATSRCGGNVRQVCKVQQPNFDTSDSGLDTDGTPRGAVRQHPTGQVALQESASFQNEAFKDTELDISLSTIEEDVRSAVSAVTSTTSLSTVDDKAFRDGIAALDANIAKVLNALEKTKKMFS